MFVYFTFFKNLYKIVKIYINNVMISLKNLTKISYIKNVIEKLMQKNL
jgi:hypothetical protein